MLPLYISGRPLAVRMDLIYEGITTKGQNSFQEQVYRQNGPDLRRDYDGGAPILRPGLA